MLDDNLKAQLKAYLERVTLPFEIEASLSDSESSAELKQLLQDIAAMSDKITLSLDGDDARRPSFSLKRTGSDQSLRFAGIPLGHEFTSLVLASTLLARNRGKKLAEIGFGAALLIGCAQAIAIVPGISRSGMTIAVALWLGVVSEDAAAFSFILSIPAIAGAGLLSAKDFITLDVPAIPLAVSFLLALVTGVLAIFIVVKALKTRRFVYFAIYCALAGIAVWTVSFFFPQIL